jgi:excisionase family DNA binding protein
MFDYLTTKELAVMLRISERKVYDLASSGEVPCIRALGKLLFPRAEITAWLATMRDGPEITDTPLPAIVAGSRDPLLDWALRESGSGLASYYDGSFDGLDRLGRRDAQAAALHIHEPNGWNRDSLIGQLGQAPLVLFQIAHRHRGLLLGRGVRDVHGFADLRGLRVMLRQPTAAGQRQFDAHLAEAGLTRDDIDTCPTPARTEEELAIALHEEKADVGFGLGALAGLYGLGFTPILTERLDLAVWRRAWFEPPMQKLISFLYSQAFDDRAHDLGHYDLRGLGTIHHNGASG